MPLQAHKVRGSHENQSALKVTPLRTNQRYQNSGASHSNNTREPKQLVGGYELI